MMHALLGAATPQSCRGAQKSACALSPRCFRRHPQYHCGIVLALTSEMAELCDRRMVEPYPDSAVRRPLRLDSDRAERQASRGLPSRRPRKA
jgi:hypothetical protein